MRIIRHEVGRTVDGIKLFRNQLIYPPQPNYMAEAHREFPKSLKKRAKQDWKDAMKKEKDGQ